MWVLSFVLLFALSPFLFETLFSASFFLLLSSGCHLMCCFGMCRCVREVDKFQRLETGITQTTSQSPSTSSLPGRLVWSASALLLENVTLLLLLLPIPTGAHLLFIFRSFFFFLFYFFIKKKFYNLFIYLILFQLREAFLDFKSPPKMSKRVVGKVFKKFEKRIVNLTISAIWSSFQKARKKKKTH